MSIKSVLAAPRNLIRRLYDWTVRWSRTRNAPYALFCIAFAESSFFPVPPDVLLIPMVIADRTKWFRNALICTLGSVTGALLGYLIGWGLYESVGVLIVETYDLQSQIEQIGKAYNDNAFMTIVTVGFTPIPYKVFTIAAGLFKLSIPILILASFVGRAGRFFLVAGLLRLFGKKIQDAIEKYFDYFALAFAALLIGGFLLVKYVRH